MVTSIADGFANGIAGISGGFDTQILGQAGYINTLQQNGVAAANGTPVGGGFPQQPQLSQAAEVVQRLHQYPHLIPQALQALQNPAVMRDVLLALKREPHLAQYLPPQIKDTLSQVLRQML